MPTMPTDHPPRPNVEAILARAATDTSTTPEPSDWYAPAWGTVADLCRYIVHLETQAPTPETGLPEGWVWEEDGSVWVARSTDGRDDVFVDGDGLNVATRFEFAPIPVVIAVLSRAGLLGDP